MSHLSPEDLIDAFEGEAGPGVAAHLAECERCRRQADALAATRHAVADDDVPEPSPLFWLRLAARVSEAIRAGAPPRREWWLQPWRSARWGWPVAAAAVLVLAVAGSLVLRTGPAPRPDVARTVADRSPVASDALAPDEAAPWELISDVTDDMDWDAVSAAGLAPMPGAADGAVVHLSDAERAELGKLLAREIAESTQKRAAGGRI